MEKGNSTVYVIDTNILIDDPEVFDRLGEARIALPRAVIRELDGMKKGGRWDRRARAARQVTRTLDELGSSQDIIKGARTASGATVCIYHSYVPIDDLASNADNRVVGTALKLHRRGRGREKVILLTEDGNMRNVARSYGIRAEGYGTAVNPSSGTGKPKPGRQARPAYRGEEKKAVILSFVIAISILILMLVLGR